METMNQINNFDLKKYYDIIDEKINLLNTFDSPIKNIYSDYSNYIYLVKENSLSVYDLNFNIVYW